ncbi:histidine phosphatase family protein [Cryobacterium sp. TMS1-20-1]|uniref:histidine phosphatase family protein n=1 Tax=Cryobacterium sp. TMS1-20-1 TaxID=1259223 RepID=UPI00351A4B07
MRHGQTDWNAAKRLQGSTDIPLNDIGRTQAGNAVPALSQFDWDFVVSSPLVRAAETADVIAGDLNLAVTCRIPGLVERDYGPAEGLIEGAELDSMRIPGGYYGAESESEVAERGLDALHVLSRENPGARIIVVTHGTLIRVTLTEALDLDVGSIDNATLNLVRHHRNTGFALHILNGTTHHTQGSHSDNSKGHKSWQL